MHKRLRYLLRYLLIACGVVISGYIAWIGAHGLITITTLTAGGKLPQLPVMTYIHGAMYILFGIVNIIGLLVSACAPALLRESRLLQRITMCLALLLPIHDLLTYIPYGTYMYVNHLYVVLDDVIFSALLACVIALGIASAWLRFFSYESAAEPSYK